MIAAASTFLLAAIETVGGIIAIILWLCANCFENGIKSFIQPSHSMGHTHTFKCSKCNSEIKAFPEDVKSLKKWKQ